MQGRGTGMNEAGALARRLGIQTRCRPTRATTHTTPTLAMSWAAAGGGVGAEGAGRALESSRRILRTPVAV